MKIGFEASRVLDKNPTGINRYANQLIRAVSRLHPDTAIYYKFSRINKRKYWISPDNVPSKLHLGPLFPLKKPDIIHGLEGYVPNWSGVGKVITLHDIFPLINKAEFVCPQSFREKLENAYTRGVASADKVVADSENTRRDVIEYFGVDETKVITVYPGIDSHLSVESEPVDSNIGSERNFFLFVGAISGRKNTARIVEAFALSKASREFDLVMVGTLAYYSHETLAAIEKHKIEDKVHLVGYVPETELVRLYRTAKGFLFPTLYEGFGFPVLDAMSMELPVLTANIGSSPEVAGGYAKLVDPYDIEAIACGIDSLTDTSAFDLAGAKEHALGFKWSATASRLLEVYKEVA